jgi:hypothetical protein
MPKNPKFINKVFQETLSNNPHLTEADNISDVPAAKEELLQKMEQSVQTLKKTGRLTPDHYQSAIESIAFYREHTKPLPWDKSPKNLLSEMVAIDYSKPVKTVNVKANRIMTQMQHPDDHRHDPQTGEFSPEVVGNFYAEGVLPDNFEKRADKSGIGIKSDRSIESNPEKEQADKSVYQLKVTKTSTFLRSVAEKADDTWSLTGETQKSQGGGVQWRIATTDYSNMERQIYGELEKRHAPSKSKPLEKGLRMIDSSIETPTKTHVPRTTRNRSHKGQSR